MDSSDRGRDRSVEFAGISKLERSLRRALATTESDEARYHVRTALQHLAVLREVPSESLGESDRPLDRQ